MSPTALAREYSEADISKDFKANGSTDAGRARLPRACRERICRLEAQGRRSGRDGRSNFRWPSCAPCRRARRSRGTTAWKAGAASANGPACRSKALLDKAELKPQARYIVFHCADDLDETATTTANITSCIGLEDAFHPADDPRLRDERRGAADAAWRAAPAPRRAAARLQDGEICDAHRGGRRASPAFAAAAAASGKTAAMSGTPASEPTPPHDAAKAERDP